MISLRISSTSHHLQFSRIAISDLAVPRKTGKSNHEEEMEGLRGIELFKVQMQNLSVAIQLTEKIITRNKYEYKGNWCLSRIIRKELERLFKILCSSFGVRFGLHIGGRGKRRGEGEQKNKLPGNWKLKKLFEEKTSTLECTQCFMRLASQSSFTSSSSNVCLFLLNSSQSTGSIK